MKNVPIIGEIGAAPLEGSVSRAWLSTAAIVCSVTFLLLLAALHVLKPSLDPSWRMVSEYSMGQYGWMMQIAFAALGLACLLDCAITRSRLSGLSGLTGWWLLAVAGVSLVVAGAFVSDPITVAPADRTTHGFVHGISAMAGIPSLSLAPLLVSRALRLSGAWAHARRWMQLTAHGTWLSLVWLLVTVAVTLPRQSGTFSAAVPTGWPNRCLVLMFSAWLITLAWASKRGPADLKTL